MAQWPAPLARVSGWKHCKFALSVNKNTKTRSCYYEPLKQLLVSLLLLYCINWINSLQFFPSIYFHQIILFTFTDFNFKYVFIFSKWNFIPIPFFSAWTVPCLIQTLL